MKVTFIFANTRISSHKFVNFLIKWIDKSKSGHFAILLDTDFTSNIFEAVSPKVREIKLDDWIKQYDAQSFTCFEVPEHKRADVIYWLKNMVGIRYGYGQVLLIGFFCIFKKLASIIPKVNLNYKSAVICTELGSRFIEKFLDYPLNKSHDEIGINDMEKIIEKISLGAKWLT